MKELCLAIGLFLAVAGGLEGIAGVAANLAASLTHTDEIDNLLDLDLDSESS